jgi:hypothetical protein
MISKRNTNQRVFERRPIHKGVFYLFEMLARSTALKAWHSSIRSLLGSLKLEWFD